MESKEHAGTTNPSYRKLPPQTLSIRLLTCRKCSQFRCPIDIAGEPNHGAVDGSVYPSIPAYRQLRPEWPLARRLMTCCPWPTGTSCRSTLSDRVLVGPTTAGHPLRQKQKS